MKSCGNSILAFIAGIAVGTGVTIFLQSEKGKELRAHVADYLEEKGVKLNKEEFESLISSVTKRFRKEVAIEE